MTVGGLNLSKFLDATDTPDLEGYRDGTLGGSPYA